MLDKLTTITKGFMAQVDYICVLLTPIMLYIIETAQSTVEPLFRYLIGIIVLTIIDIFAATFENDFKFSWEKAKESFKRKLFLFALTAFACGTIEFVLSADIETLKNFYLTKALCSLHMVMDLRSTLKHVANSGYTPAASMFNLLKKRLPEDIREAIEEVEKQDENK